MNEQNTNEVMVVPQGMTIQERPTFLSMEPKEMIARARAVADELNQIINQKKLFTNIGPKKYVHVDGWVTMGALLGITPKEDYVKECEDGTFEAGVSIVRSGDGRVISSASAICGSDEKTWAGRPRYARRSMATTRATGKAYRLAFGWVMQLAGYESTPADEIEEFISPPKNQEKTNHPEIYTGEGIQKNILNSTFGKYDISDPEKKKKAHLLFIEKKINMKELDAAVREIRDGGL